MARSTLLHGSVLQYARRLSDGVSNCLERNYFHLGFIIKYNVLCWCTLDSRPHNLPILIPSSLVSILGLSPIIWCARHATYISVPTRSTSQALPRPQVFCCRLSFRLLTPIARANDPCVFGSTAPFLRVLGPRLQCSRQNYATQSHSHK